MNILGRLASSGTTKIRLGKIWLSLVIAYFLICALPSPIVLASPGLPSDSGQRAYDSGDFPAAITLWENATQKYLAGGSNLAAIDSMLGISKALRNMGRHGAALELSSKAQSFA